MGKGDKISVNLQKLEGSMSGIMNQMGLGVNVVGGGSKGVPKKDNAAKKSTKPSNDSRSLNDSKSSGVAVYIDTKKGDEKKKSTTDSAAAYPSEKKKTADGKVKVETHPSAKKKEDSATANLSDVNRRKP